MIAERIGLVAVCVTAVVAPAGAQEVDFHLTANQSFTSVDVLGSPTGFQLGVGAGDLWGRWGLRFDWRRVSEGSGEIAEHCTFFACAPGPFDQARVLRTAAVSLTFALVRTDDLTVDVGAAGSLSWQHERLERVGTGHVTTDDRVGPDRGFGLRARVRFGDLAAGFHPVASVAYDRVGSSECAADAACFGGRDVFDLGVGIAWVPR